MSPEFIQKRRQRVLELIAQGLNSSAVAERLGVSRSMVSELLKSVRREATGSRGAH